MKLTIFLLAALLAMAAAQTRSPSPSGAASPTGAASPSAAPGSQFTNCNTLLLNGTGNFDIVLLGAAGASPSGSPSVSGSPSASISGSPAASGSPAGSPAGSPSVSRSPSASISGSPAASGSPATSPSAQRLLQVNNALLGGRVAVNGDASLTNSIVGGSLSCPSPSAAISGSPSPSGSPAASVSRSPSASVSGSPAASGSPAGSPAASGSPSASGSPAASGLPSASGSPAAQLSLLVRGNLEITNSQIACGGLAVSGNVAGSPVLGQPNAANLTGQQAIASSGIDFTTLRQRLLATSEELCSLPATGQTSINQFGAAVLDASRTANQTSGGATAGGGSANASNVVIFELPSSSLANLTSVLINGTSNSTFVIINVVQNQTGATGGVSGGGAAGAAGGSNLTLTKFGIETSGLNASNILWNFCNATDIQINDILLVGSLLAPRAAINVNRAEVEGELIAQSLRGNFFNHIPQRFQGNFCPTAGGGQQPSGASPSPQASP